MNRLFIRANKRIGLGNAAALLVGTALFGQLLGFLRVKLINANFSDIGGQSTDAYFAAFKIPDFFFYTIAAGALGVAFIPFLSERLAKNDREGAWELCNSLMNMLAIAMAVVSLAIFIFAEPLIKHIVAPTIAGEQLHNAATIMRLIALNPLFFTISGIISSVQQTYGRFFFFAIAPLFYNVSIIISIYVFKHNLGIIGLGIGAMIGALLQLLVASLGLFGLKFKYKPTIKWGNRDFKSILRQLPARSIDQGIDSINTIVETNLAKRLGDGILSSYENAYVLHNAPTQLIGTTIATAAFPRLAARLAGGRPDLFRKDFLRIVRTMIWITAPVIVISFFARAYLARLIFSKSAPQIALIFGYLTVAIFFRIIYSISSRWFYAQKDTKTPLFVSLFIIALNVILAYVLSRKTSYGVAGLAMAQSIVAATEVAILTIIMCKRDPKLIDRLFMRAMVRIVSVTGFSLLAALTMVSIFPLGADDRGFVSLGGKLMLISGATLVTHVLASSIFGLEEVKPVFSRIRRIILSTVKI